IGALACIRVQQVAGGVHGGEPDAMLPQLARQAIALRLLPNRGEVEMRARPRAPGADADLHVGDAARRAPGQHLAPPKPGQRIRKHPDPHDIAFRYAEISSATSDVACSTVVSTDARPVAA